MSAEFVCSAASADQFPKDGLPEIAFVGRSNVGKSSLLNTLILRSKKQSGAAAGRKQLARISRTPGRTRSVNFYRVEHAFYFVDLPGYGYAKVSRKALAQWRRLAESYLNNRSALCLVVLVVDLRRRFLPLDLQMRDWLTANGQRFIVAGSKADKLGAAERASAIRVMEESFGPVLPFSAKTGEGASALWDNIRRSLQTCNS